MGYFDPFKYYKTNSPLRSDSRFHKQDLAAIKASSHKSDTATELINQRRDEKIIRDIDRELDQVGRKKVIYDQGAVLLIEHMWPHAPQYNPKANPEEAPGERQDGDFETT